MTIDVTSLAGLRSRAVLRTALAIGALGLASGCGSTALPTAPGGGTGPGSGSQFTSIQSSIAAGKTATYKAGYTSTSGTETSKIVIEQSPPNQLFSVDDTSIITQGTTSYYCSTSDSATTCTVEPAGQNPLAGMASLFDGSTALTIMQSFDTQVAAHMAGVNITYSNATYAGEASTCMDITASGQNSKYCVTNKGILAFEGTAGSSFELTSFTTDVSASDFQPPAGATIETPAALPSGFGLPTDGSVPYPTP